MPALKGTKRKSEQMSTSDNETSRDGFGQAHVQATYGSPMKKRKTTITTTQKQALIDNLQLEITERARKLRAQYNLQAQSLRTRIEMRINRIPKPLREVTLGDLLAKYASKSQEKPAAALQAPPSSRPPPVPEKDFAPPRPALHRALLSQAPTSRPGTSWTIKDDCFGEGDKENTPEIMIDAKSKTQTTKAQARQGQVLSPASSNARVAPRVPSPIKSGLARPVSPTKGAASTLLSNMVEKARSTRAAASTRNRPTTASSTTSSSTTSAPTAGTARTRRGAAAAPSSPVKPASKATKVTAATGARTHRVSGVSESSDGSTSTVIRKGAAAAKKTTATAPAAKRSVMSTIKKGVGASTTKATAGRKAAATPAVPGGRVLRKRT